MGRTISKTRLLTESGLALEYFPDYRKRTQEMHAVDTVLISIILKGNCRHYIDDREYEEGPGDGGIIHYHQNHKLLPQDSIDHLNIYVDPRKLDFSLIPRSLHGSLAEILPFEEKTVHNYNRIIHFRFPDPEKAETLLFLMLEEYGKSERESGGLLMSYFSLITAEIVRGMKKESRDPIGRALGPSPPLLTVLDWLDIHYREPVSGEELAALAGWSHSWLCRTFKKEVGITIQEYVVNKRISWALFHIINTRRTILSIALDAGFNDVNFFNRKFRDVTGLSPGEYRKRSRTS